LLKPDLAERLKTLGVKVGAKDITAPVQRNPHTIEHVIPGVTENTLYGEAYVVINEYSTQIQHGLYPLSISTPPEIVALWAGENEILHCCAEEYAFLDIETTGLSSSAGTYAFLIGVGRAKADIFQVKQFFLRNPAEEDCQLVALAQFLSGCRVLVTFNGKAFDVPVLRTRFTLQGLSAPFSNLCHLDLLHLARRLWKERLPSRTLLDLEAQILGILRDQADIPSWIIPQLYVDYLNSGDARLIKSVFYHNLKDVLSMVTLLNHLTSLLEDPLNRPETPAIDLVGIARLYEALGNTTSAALLYEQALSLADLPSNVFLQAVERLSFLFKQRGKWDAAVSLWEIAAAHAQLYAHVELAKFYEHQRRDYASAENWVESALQITFQAGFPTLERSKWRSDLEYRLSRLQKKRNP